MKHYFCFLVLSVLLLIPIDTYSSSQAISLKVGETKTVSLPRDVTSKNTYAFNCSTDQSTCIDIVSFDKYSVSLRGAKEFKGTVYVYYDFFYEENGRRHSDTHTIMVDVYEQGTGGGTSGSGDDSWGTGYQDKGCWGTITVTKGSEQTVYANFPVVNEDKVKCYKWSSKGSPAFSITSKNWNKCVVKGEFTGFTGSSSRLYCYMEYGTNSYQAYYDINVTAPKVTLVSNISLNKESVSLSTEETTQLTPTISPSNATYKTVTWASDNIDVATVSSNGLVKAVGEGSATITCRATDGSGVIATCKITVKKPVPPTGIIVSPSSMNINIGDTKTLSYSLTPTDATTTVTWKSDNTSIATVSSSGLVKGIAEGKTTIRATTSNGLSSTCIVNVKGIDTDYIFLPTLANVKVGSTTTLTYSTMPTNATNSVEWYSDDTSIATVTSSGIVKGIKEGSTVIRVKTDNGRCSACKINVASSNVSPTNIEIVHGPYHVEEGYSLRMYYELTPSDAITKLTWTSEDPSVMTVSKEGVITSIKPNSSSVCISVKTDNGKEAKLSVYSGNLKGDYYEGYAQDGCLWSYKIIDKEKRTCHLSYIPVYDRFHSNLVVPSELCGYTVTSYSGCRQDDVVSVTIPNTITEIPKEAFEHCTGLVTVFLPDNLKEIGEDAFSSCYSLKNINIPQTVISIGDWAFSYCESLEKIDLPENLAKIGRGTFFRCKSLKRFSVPKGITEIGSKAFNWCDNLEEIELPSNLQTIGEEAFGYSRNLKTIKCFMEKPIAIDESVFSTQFYWGIATLYVPFGTKSLYASADVWKNFKNIVEFDPTGIDDITVDEDAQQTIYSISGVRLKNPQKGINIINGKKVLVK